MTHTKAWFVAAFSLGFALALSGCGAVLQVTKPVSPGTLTDDGARAYKINGVKAADGTDVPASIVHVVEESLQKALHDAGLSNEPVTLSLEVEVTGYRMRDSFTRFMFGVFAGSDWIEADVRVFAEGIEAPVTEVRVKASNSAAFGDERTVGRMLAKKVVGYLETLGADKGRAAAGFTAQLE